MNTPLRALINGRIDHQGPFSHGLNLVGPADRNDLWPLRNRRLGNPQRPRRRRNGPKMLDSCFSIHERDSTAC
jgi:hypothetical protein